jgi:4-hydroxy-3-polyprenylbenzoate decarboxylase
MEDCYLAKATERLLLPMIRLDLPEIVDINLPLEGIFHGCAMVAMEKRHSGHPVEVIEALWSKGWLSNSRLLVMVDADIDVNDLSLIAWKVLNIVDWRRDLVVSATERDTVPLGRLALDATRKMNEAGELLECQKEVGRPPSILRMVEKRWRKYGL